MQTFYYLILFFFIKNAITSKLDNSVDISKYPGTSDTDKHDSIQICIDGLQYKLVNEMLSNNLILDDDCVKLNKPECKTILVGDDSKSGLCNQVREEYQDYCSNMITTDCLMFVKYIKDSNSGDINNTTHTQPDNTQPDNTQPDNTQNDNTQNDNTQSDTPTNTIIPTSVLKNGNYINYSNVYYLFTSFILINYF